MVPRLKNALGGSHKFIYLRDRVVERGPNCMIINLLLLGFQQVDSYISHQTENKYENDYVPANSLHRNAHYFYQYIYSSLTTMSTTGPEFNLKCLVISDKTVYWAIQAFSPGSLNDQWNILVAHLEQSTPLLLRKLTKWFFSSIVALVK